MRRTISILTALLLLAAPVGARAEDELPAPIAIECPATVTVDGIARIPDDAPADCVYPEALPMPVAGDPCAPDAQGTIPEACLTGPVDESPSCWISSSGATSCPGESPMPTAASRSFEIVSVSASGAPFTVSGRLTFYETPGRIGATVGCNSIGGAATLGADGSISLGEIFSTEMYCADLADAEAALLAVLAGDGLRLNGDRLSSDAGTLDLRAITTVGETEKSGSSGSLVASLVLILILATIGLLARRRSR